MVVHRFDRDSHVGVVIHKGGVVVRNGIDDYAKER